VRTEAVDRFLASVGDLMQHQARLEKLQRDLPYWDGKPEFDEELSGMQRIVRDLRRRALDIRTTPVRRVLERLPRVAGELARALGKSVRVDLVGEEVEVDRAVLDHLDEPLLHLVRNALDHGLETSEERATSGKPPVGRLRIAATSGGGRLKVRVEDDGRGLAVERVRRRAVERGMPREVAEDLPTERLGELLFEPGMSTADEVSEVSGRGVGLDAVKRTIESLGGSVTVLIPPEGGMAFELDLPSMVALQRILVLHVGGHRVALPITRLDAVIDVREASIERAGGETFMVYQDEPIPLLDLAERIGLPRSRDDEGGNVVLIEARGFRLGLRVKRAVGDQEVYVREVPRALASLRHLGGVATLSDGAPVFLLEMGRLLENFA
jgi:two-component system, chemotaxis family, sensor kinase CheA